jgi:hypothetical protein
VLAGPDRENRLPDLQDQLRRAQGVTADLISKVVAGACTRVTMPGGAGNAARINRLIESEAWTEAALALVELEFPQWRLQRLAYDEVAWLCSLSKPSNPQVWLNDHAQARHRSLPLAILGALIEARQCNEPSSAPPPLRTASSVPQCRPNRASLSQPCAATTLPEPKALSA